MIKGPRYFVQYKDGLSRGWLYLTAQHSIVAAAERMAGCTWPQVRILDREDNVVVASRTHFDAKVAS